MHLRFRHINDSSVAHIIKSIMVSLLLFGCEKEIDINLNASAGKPVVYAFIQPDSTFSISLSRSVSSLSPNNMSPLTDATIHIYKNSIFSHVIDYNANNSWNRFNNVNFNAGDSVKINILTNNAIIATTKTRIPSRIPISNIDTVRVYKVGDDGFWSEHINLSFKFTDPKDTANYYQIMMIEKVIRPLADGDTTEIDTLSIPDTDKAIFSTTQGTSNLGAIDFQGLFTDKNINGTTHQLTMSIPAKKFRKQSDATSKTYEIRLYHLSDDYYNYFRAQIISNSFEGLPIFDPVEIPSNVQNGYGLVTGLTLSAYLLNVQ